MGGLRDGYRAEPSRRRPGVTPQSFGQRARAKQNAP
ncbi:hypothetical protein EDF44_2281 [Rathayibacter sp. PhB185]|nr:hypothetical protein EDF45_2118 [Rathayibacter sp. PhB186]ROS51942.1 hypothetical protein EDF44_2281 [Rathayibacter sp. PhB185]